MYLNCMLQRAAFLIIGNIYQFACHYEKCAKKENMRLEATPKLKCLCLGFSLHIHIKLHLLPKENKI